MTEPQLYYDHAGIQLWWGDCRDVLPRLPAGSVDLIVTDPPYGVRWQGSHQRRVPFPIMAGDDSPDVGLEGIRLALRVLKEKRHLYVFGRFDLTGFPVSAQAELIWDKCILGLGSGATVWTPQHEYVQFATYQPSKASRAAGGGVLSARLRRGSVLRYPRLSGSAVCRHPTEKPVMLLRELIESSSRFGETVLDPFVGSGTTLVAARREGRRAIGIEISKAYCAVAVERLRQEESVHAT